MRKRERENPCGICGHYHKYEEGEVCGVCGHRMAVPISTTTIGGAGGHVSAFATEVLPDFLFLGSYDNAARAEMLKMQGITKILNTVPSCQNLYKNSFSYHCLAEESSLPFDSGIQFLEECEKEKARVLVHCMSGKNRSPAIVMAYLMKCKGWRLAQSYQWVKERRPAVELHQDTYQQLQAYEQKVFGPVEYTPMPNIFPSSNTQLTFGMGFPQVDSTVPQPAFASPAAESIFDNAALNVPPSGFSFGAHRNVNSAGNPPTGNDNVMDSS